MTEHVLGRGGCGRAFWGGGEAVKEHGRGVGEADGVSDDASACLVKLDTRQHRL